MTQQNKWGEQSDCNMAKRHIASLTNSEMIMLNLEQIQSMSRFAYDIVISDEEQNKIYAYQYENNVDGYLMITPLCFYSSTKYKCKMFVEMLCLCSQTITVPLDGPYFQKLANLLDNFGLKFKYKKGNTVVKMYMESECFINYLDLVTFQAIQFKGKDCKQLMAMKKSNSYQFCINYFKQQVMTELFNGPQDSIQNLLQNYLVQIRQIYELLVCSDRFEVLYNLMEQKNHSFKELQRQIQAIMLEKHITTVADEEYDEIIGNELSNIINQEISKYKSKLIKMKSNEQQVLSIKILQNLLQKFREYNFQINDHKYLFITSKIIENIYSLKQEEEVLVRKEKQMFVNTILAQEKQIQRLKESIEKINENLSAKVCQQLPIIQEVKQEKQIKKSNSESLFQAVKQAPLTIKDLVQPLKIISSNSLHDKQNKTGLIKTRQKPKEGFKKKESDSKASLKSTRKI